MTRLRVETTGSADIFPTLRDACTDEGLAWTHVGGVFAVDVPDGHAAYLLGLAHGARLLASRMEAVGRRDVVRGIRLRRLRDEEEHG